MVYCPVCGSENPEDAEECRKCGKNLKHIINNVKSEEREFNLLTISGYVFIILGLFSLGTLSIVGLILGYKTFNQNDPRAKTHGFIIMILNLVVILFWILLLFFVPNWLQSSHLNESMARFFR
jgi:uncharacterized membrane protein YvbJ